MTRLMVQCWQLELSGSAWRNSVKHFCLCQNTLYCKKTDNHSNDKSSVTEENDTEPNVSTILKEKHGAKFSEYTKFKAKRRSLSPAERLGNLLSNSSCEQVTDINISDTGVINKNETSMADSRKSSKHIISNKEQYKKSVIPSKRLQSMIPDEYWKTESEDTKEIVDNLGSNIDIADGHKD